VTEGAHGGKNKAWVGMGKKERGTTCKFFKRKKEKM